MAEYFGGLLAASKSTSGRDDRGAMWTATVASMSSVEIRAHYLLYREWACLIHGRTDLILTLGRDSGRRAAKMYLPVSTFAEVLGEAALPGSLSHAIPHLVRLGLLDLEYGYGDKQENEATDSRFDRTLKVHPSVAGMELYGWAQGVPGLEPQLFPIRAVPFESEPPLLRIEGAYLPIPEPRPQEPVIPGQ